MLRFGRSDILQIKLRHIEINDVNVSAKVSKNEKGHQSDVLFFNVYGGLGRI